MPDVSEDSIEVTPQQVAELLEQGRVQLVDVREAYEVEAGRLAGARHIGLAQLGEAAQTLDPATPIVFYCRVGGRSAMAAQAFRTAGYPAYSLTGGLLAWAQAGLPLEPEDGTVAPH